MRKILEALSKKKGTNAKKTLDLAARKQLADKKKQYMSARKQKLTELGSKQKSELAAVKQRVAQLPKGQRTSEGKRMRAAIREKYAKLKKKIPTAAKKGIGEVVSLIKGIKTLRV